MLPQAENLGYKLVQITWETVFERIFQLHFANKSSRRNFSREMLQIKVVERKLTQNIQCKDIFRLQICLKNSFVAYFPALLCEFSNQDVFLQENVADKICRAQNYLKNGVQMSQVDYMSSFLHAGGGILGYMRLVVELED